MKQITVKLRKAYGNELIDPVCETAHCLTKLTGRKTFTKADIHWIKILGYKVLVQQEVAEL